VGLDVYFRRDIAHVLRATACASEGSMELAIELLGGASGPASDVEREKLLQAYRQGVRNTLLSVGLAFGLEVRAADGSPSVQRTPGAEPGLAGLLWAEIPHER
jgi:hypothetical protein